MLLDQTKAFMEERRYFPDSIKAYRRLASPKVRVDQSLRRREKKYMNELEVVCRDTSGHQSRR